MVDESTVPLGERTRLIDERARGIHLLLADSHVVNKIAQTASAPGSRFSSDGLDIDGGSFGERNDGDGNEDDGNTHIKRLERLQWV